MIKTGFGVLTSVAVAASLVFAAPVAAKTKMTPAQTEAVKKCKADKAAAVKDCKTKGAPKSAERKACMKDANQAYKDCVAKAKSAT